MTEAGLFSCHEIRPGITLYHHRSRKWKKEVMRMAFVGAPDDEAAERSLGAALFRHGHRSRRGMDRVLKFFQDLYGGGFYAQTSRTARHHLLVMRGVVVDGRYLPRHPDTFEALVEHAGKLLKSPWFAQKSFDDDIFEVERRNLLRAIDGIADNKSQYADQRLMEEMFQGHPLGVPGYGRREDVAEASRDEVIEVVQGFTAEKPLLIYVVGSRAPSAVIKILKKHIPDGSREEFRIGKFSGPAIRSRVRTVKEEQEISQARLAMGFRLEGYRRSRDLHAGHVGDAIFGGSSSSKLFRDVREKKSLAYSIHSTFEGGTGTLYVSAGTDTANLDRVTRLVKKHVAAMAAGDFSVQDRATALAAIKSSLEATRDSAEAMIAYHLGATLVGRKDRHPDLTCRRYEKVDPKRIADVFSRLKLDTVFRLEASS